MYENTNPNQYIHHRNLGIMMQQNSAKKPAAQREIRVLVVEDEEPLRELLRISLVKAGYRVITANNGQEALELFNHNPADLVLMDVMMPIMDGFTACVELRKRSDVPIVMLSALNRPDDIVYGFSLGADDYICKPFTFREVEARLQAIVRRIAWINERPDFQVMAFNDVVMDDDLHEVRVRDKVVHLTPTEYQLLRHLMSLPDRPVSKDELFQHVWGYSVAGGTNLVEVAMRRLREKIEEDPSQPSFLLTVRGAGYKFNTQPVKEKAMLVS